MPTIGFSYTEFYYLALGMMMMMFAYIMVSFVQIRERVYLYYALYIGAQVLFFSLQKDDILSGKAIHVCWLLLVTRCGAWFFYNLFATDFLKLKNRDEWLFTYTKWNIRLALLAFFVMSVMYVFGATGLAKTTLDIAKLFIYALGIMVVVKVLRWKDAPSRYFVIGSLLIMACETVNMLLMKFCHTHLGMANVEHISPQSVLAHPAFFSIIGVVLDLLLLSLGLVHQYRETTIENLRAEYEKQRALEDERNRIARDMHDDLGSGLSALQMMSQVAVNMPQTDASQTSIKRIANLSRELNLRVREIVWTTSSEADTLPSLVYYLRRFCGDIAETQNIDFRAFIPENLPETAITGNMRRNVFLCVKEIINNSMKYADATEINMRVALKNKQLSIELSDNGAGFNLENALHGGGNGLRNMQQRMAEIHGDIDFQSKKGTVIKLTFPV